MMAYWKPKHVADVNIDNKIITREAMYYNARMGHVRTSIVAAENQ